jgi:AmmeMemoRadiSam system protein B
MRIRLFIITLGTATLVFLVLCFGPKAHLWGPSAQIISTHVEQSILNAAWAPADTTTTQGPVIACTINHHLLAANLIAQTLRPITQNVQTILLVSPDHFTHSRSYLTTTAARWATADGLVEAPDALIRTLRTLGVSEDQSPFPEEHGIGNVLPFLHRVFPKAKIAPLLVRTNYPVADAVRFGQQLVSKLPPNTLIVGSFDFSHNHTLAEANMHDTESLRAIAAHNYNTFSALDVDSPAGLALVTAAAEQLGATTFDIVTHSNSAQLTQILNAQETTSYLNGYFHSPPNWYTLPNF